MSAKPRRLLAIGIGAGDPRHLTLEAVRAIGRADAFFLPDKGSRAAGLTRIRGAILREHARDSARVVTVTDPQRTRHVADDGAYRAQVDEWRHRRAAAWTRLLRDELAPGETGALLVWGDPALYDSTTSIMGEIQRGAGFELACSVVPGISSISALAARHRTTWTRAGRPARISTGRHFADAPQQEEDTLVLLNVAEAIDARRGGDWWIYWGAYLGTPDEVVVSGALDRVADRILRMREESRAHHGWIMDACLLRRHDHTSGAPPEG